MIQPDKTSHPPLSISGVTILIPAYNERDGIGPVLEQLLEEMTALDHPHEILVVDDGSQDGTAHVVESYPAVRLIRHKANRGYGAALKTGIRHAAYDLVCIADADGTYPLDRIPDLVNEIGKEDVDMVVGARSGPDSAIPAIRKPAKWFISRLAELVVNEPIPDLNSGLRIFKRPAVYPFFNILPDGFSFTTTITLGMITNGYLVGYLPIAYHARVGKSKIRPIRDTRNFIGLVLRIALYFAPLKVFLPVSAFLFVLALAWAYFTHRFLGQLADASTAVIVMTAVQVAMLGFMAEVVNRRMPGFQKPEEPVERHQPDRWIKRGGAWKDADRSG